MIEAAAAQFRSTVRETAFRVHPDNASAVRLFLGMATQWNMITINTLERVQLRQVGLRYEALDRVARGLGIDEQPGDFMRVQLMEAAALTALAQAQS